MTDDQSIVAGLRRALGVDLAARRMERKLTQAQLANHLDVHRTTITHVEAGDHGASLTFWKLADDFLTASGALVAACEQLREAAATRQRDKADALHDALSRAQVLRNEGIENDLCDLLGRASGFHMQKLHYYSANALAWAGEIDSELIEGSRSLALYDAAEPAQRSVAAAATVRIDMSLILLRKRQLREAVTILSPVLSIGVEHRDAGLRQQLHRELTMRQNQAPLTRDVTADIDSFCDMRGTRAERSAADRLDVS